MNCEKCQDRGFTEENHGLIMRFCDCEKGRWLRSQITGQPLQSGEIDDSINRTGQPDSTIGSEDTSRPKRTSKPKARKKTRARAS